MAAQCSTNPNALCFVIKVSEIKKRKQANSGIRMQFLYQDFFLF